MTKILSLLCLLLAIGCSSVSFVSLDTVPVVFEKKEQHTRDISIKVTKDYYLWGLFPDTREIRIDKVFAGAGMDSVAEVKIEEKSEGKNIAWTLFTLGFYTPKTYVLSGKIKK